MFLEAWDLKDSEVSESTDREISKTESELYKLKKELASTESKITVLEKENERLQKTLATHLSQNQKLRSFKENLKKTLNPSESLSRIPSTYTVFSPSTESIDGKNFFKEARNRLSYETFAIFLGYVKRLNDKTITKEKALEELQIVFGAENCDLHEDFSSLLLRKSSEYEL